MGRVAKKIFLTTLSLIVIIVLCLIVSNKGIRLEMIDVFSPKGETDKKYLMADGPCFFSIYLYDNGRFKRKDYTYGFHSFYSGTYTMYQGDIVFDYDLDHIPPDESSKGYLSGNSISINRGIQYKNDSNLAKRKDGTQQDSIQQVFILSTR